MFWDNLCHTFGHVKEHIQKQENWNNVLIKYVLILETDSSHTHIFLLVRLQNGHFHEKLNIDLLMTPTLSFYIVLGKL